MTGKPERKQLAGRSMIIPSYLLTLCALLFLSCGPTVAQSVAVFDFELIDTSLEGAIRGARADERERLARLSDQLRHLLRESAKGIESDPQHEHLRPRRFVGSNDCSHERGHARQYRRVVVTHAQLVGSQSAPRAWLWS